MSDLVKTELINSVLVVTFNRPRKKNALTQEMYAVMADAIERAESDTAVKVVLYTGTDGVFTAGNDLGDFGSGDTQGEQTHVDRFIQNMATTDVPLVGAVNGIAIGVGTTMLLHFDQVFASSQASFSMPFVNLGLVPEAGSSKLLVAQCGYKNAARLLMLGERFSAEEAKKVGIVSSISDDVLNAAMSFAEKLAAKPRGALRATKRLIRRDPESLSATLREEGSVFGERLSSPEFAEAAAAFSEKREPNFAQFD